MRAKEELEEKDDKIPQKTEQKTKTWKIGE